MKISLVPIIESKTGDSSDKHNDRSIALVFEICRFEILELFLVTNDQQFGFKSKHDNAMCSFTVRSIIKHYTEQNTNVYTCTPVYTCFLDASKAFGRINHWTLFHKLINCKIPLIIERPWIFWYQPN